MDNKFDLATIPKYPRTKQDRQLVDLTYSNFFEHALDTIATGRTLSSTIQNDHRQIEYARFLRWIRRSPARLARYHEAQEIAAEILAAEVIAISDGSGDSMLESPVDRDNARIKARQWLAGAYNKNRYGSNKSVEMKVTEVTDQELAKLSTNDLKKMILEAEYETVEEDEDDLEEWMR